METAFSEVEKHVGYTDHPGELVEVKQVTSLAEWLALHAVRCRQHRDVALAGGRDYRAAVDLMKDRILTYHGYFADFNEPVFITGDNPVVLMATPEQRNPEWFVIPLSPRRCLYVVAEPKMPSEPGLVGLKPSTVNQMVCNAATEYCLSFDTSLHLP